MRVHRQCYACGSNETKMGKSYRRDNSYILSPQWLLNKGTDLALCHYCWKKYIIRWGPLSARQRKIRYKGKNIGLRFNPRMGKCSNCGKVDGKKTHMHHMYYDDNDPLAGTIELCIRCHMICTAFESREAKLLFSNGIIKI